MSRNDKTLIEKQCGVEAWGSVPFYVVGQGTAATLAEIQTLHKCTLDIRGSSSGTSERLARFIVNDLQPASTPAPVTGKLLYLIGDKNRDDLPNILHENNIKLLSLQVYKTQGSPALEQNLSEAISEPSKSGLSVNDVSVINSIINREPKVVDRLFRAILSRICHARPPKIL